MSSDDCVRGTREENTLAGHACGRRSAFESALVTHRAVLLQEVRFPEPLAEHPPIHVDVVAKHGHPERRGSPLRPSQEVALQGTPTTTRTRTNHMTLHHFDCPWGGRAIRYGQVLTYYRTAVALLWAARLGCFSFHGDCAALGARAGVRRRAIAGSGRSAVVARATV